MYLPVKLEDNREPIVTVIMTESESQCLADELVEALDCIDFPTTLPYVEMLRDTIWMADDSGDYEAVQILNRLGKGFSRSDSADFRVRWIGQKLDRAAEYLRNRQRYQLLNPPTPESEPPGPAMLDGLRIEGQTARECLAVPGTLSTHPDCEPVAKYLSDEDMKRGDLVAIAFLKHAHYLIGNRQGYTFSNRDILLNAANHLADHWGAKVILARQPPEASRTYCQSRIVPAVPLSEKELIRGDQNAIDLLRGFSVWLAAADPGHAAAEILESAARHLFERWVITDVDGNSVLIPANEPSWMVDAALRVLCDARSWIVGLARCDGLKQRSQSGQFDTEVGEYDAYEPTRYPEPYRKWLRDLNAKIESIKG